MRVVWMPYFRIDYPHGGPKETGVGKARFLPDTDATWTEVLGRPRPEHLTIFRSFPKIGRNEPGEPIRGTVVISDDETWLRKYIDEAVAVIYFLGDQRDGGRPAECFAYHPLELSDADNPAQYISFWTKHGELWETADSITVYPPLEVRARMGEYRLDLARPEHHKLLETFDNDPVDRLVVAVRQYFRTQFSNVFTSPISLDYATHCSVIEAALNCDARQGAGDNFVRALTTIYGSEDGLEKFFLGLYVTRSLYVHGISPSDVEEVKNKEMEAYQYFQSLHAKITATRMLSRDILLRSLGRRDNPYLFDPPDSAKPLLHTIMQSDTLWDQIRRTLTRCKAADHIVRLNDEEFKNIEDMVVSAAHRLHWECVRQDIDLNQMFGSLCTCALIVAKVTKGTGEVYVEMDKLGTAASRRDAGAVRDWFFEHYDWKDLMVGDRLQTIQLLAALLAGYFETVKR